jgi:hypothetical protein
LDVILKNEWQSGRRIAVLCLVIFQRLLQLNSFVVLSAALVLTPGKDSLFKHRFYFFRVLTGSANQRNWVVDKPINNQLLYG